MEVPYAPFDNPHMANRTISSKDQRPIFFFRQWRIHRNLTQEELAEMVGLTPSSISQLEGGKQGFSDTTLIALAKALECSPGDLLMRNPLDDDPAEWSIWEDVKRSSQRDQIVAVVKTMLGQPLGTNRRGDTLHSPRKLVL